MESPGDFKIIFVYEKDVYHKLGITPTNTKIRFHFESFINTFRSFFDYNNALERIA